MKEINLDKIIESGNGQTFSSQREAVKYYMRKAACEALELAADEAKIITVPSTHKSIDKCVVDEQSILNLKSKIV